jgi:arylsulfatase A-like enzyme
MSKLNQLTFLRFILALCSFSFPVLLFAQDPPLNIILIIADDLGYETLTCNGGESYQTPHLDQLAAKGARFTRTYATPLCTPSRVQIMTGQYSFRNYKRFGYLDPTQRTFANDLQDAGYRTAIAGKWQLSGNEQSPHSFGFDQYCLWQLYKGDFWYRYKSPRIIQDGQQLETSEKAYGPDVFTNFLLDFISTNQDAPFFAYYPMVLVHDPFQPTPDHPDFEDFKLEGLNDTTYFKDLVRYMDQQVGKIYQHLDSLGLLDNTVLIFTGDNGTDRDVISRFQGQNLQGHKGFTTDAGTHVPMIVYAEATVAPGTIYEHLVDFTDIRPTLNSIAGINESIKPYTDGSSFWAALTGQSKSAPRDAIFCSYNPMWANFTPRTYIQDTEYKLYSSGQFYHFTEDPKENQPLNVKRLNHKERRHFRALKRKLRRFLPDAVDFLEKDNRKSNKD